MTVSCQYAQMQYGSIGWAVGATLGYASAFKGKKRVLLSVGDGSFQVTAQVSHMLGDDFLQILLHMFVHDKTAAAESPEWYKDGSV